MASATKPANVVVHTSNMLFDLPYSEAHPLRPIFRPKSVAVVGASEEAGSIGRTVLWNLLSSPFGGTIYPIHAKSKNILGVRAYANLHALPEVVDLMVVTTPADGVLAVIQEAVEVGIPSAILMSDGFKGEQGKQLEAEILKTIRGKMRLIGSNSLGVMNPMIGLNASCAAMKGLRPGKVALLSHSGALGTAILDWGLKENVGFSCFVSIGSMLDVNWGDLIDYLGDDPRTKSIVIYMESIGDARSFLSAAREISLNKPILVIKGGRSPAAAKAAASHTGSLIGSFDVLEAAFRRTGILCVDSIGDVFHMTDVLAKQPRLNGRRLCILTNAGGPGVVATDVLVGGGGKLAVLSPETMQELNKLLPETWSHNNPVDMIGDADEERYARTLEILAHDAGIDGMLVILCPRGMMSPTPIAERLIPYAKTFGRPILASWMGGASVAASVDILNRAGIPCFEFPDTAARAFNYMWQYAYNLRGIYETPQLNQLAESPPDCQRTADIIDSVHQSGRTVLTEYESKKLLQSYGIPMVPTEIANTREEAVAIAESMTYPVVLKLHSSTITHKMDVGGVVLNLADAEAVTNAFTSIEKSVTEKAGAEHFQGVTVQPMIKDDGYELVLGSSVDAQFGPVLLLGAGGQLLEVLQDKALGLPPLNSTLARRMVKATNIYQAMKGVRGRKPVDLNALDELMVRFSNLVVENPRIKEVEINPLLASPDRLIGLDARVILHGRDINQDELPKSAIRPYPVQYVSAFKMPDGQEVVIRPIRPEDEPLIRLFHESLSERSVYMRYFTPLQLKQRIRHERMSRSCFIDYDRAMALVMERETNVGDREIIAVSRMTKLHGRNEAELAVLVRDDFQNKGLGTELLGRMIEIAKHEHLAKLIATILVNNHEMRSIVTKFGFQCHTDWADNSVEAELDL